MAISSNAFSVRQNQPSKNSKKSYSTVYLVGCGGVGGHLLSTLVRTIDEATAITLLDGDTVEPHNLDRQFFREEQIGMNKAEALLENTILPGNMRVDYLDRYFTDRTSIEPGSLVFACVDNHAARRYVLDAADRSDSDVIVCANEYEDAQAYYYTPAWHTSRLDPRTRFTALLTDQSGDPTNPACTGIEQERSPQLALYNQLAAGMGLHLYWLVTHYQLSPEVMACQHFCNFNRFRTESVGDLEGV